MCYLNLGKHSWEKKSLSSQDWQLKSRSNLNGPFKVIGHTGKTKKKTHFAEEQIYALDTIKIISLHKICPHTGFRLYHVIFDCKRLID